MSSVIDVSDNDLLMLWGIKGKQLSDKNNTSLQQWPVCTNIDNSRQAFHKLLPWCGLHSSQSLSDLWSCSWVLFLLLRLRALCVTEENGRLKTMQWSVLIDLVWVVTKFVTHSQTVCPVSLYLEFDSRFDRVSHAQAPDVFIHMFDLNFQTGPGKT